MYIQLINYTIIFVVTMAIGYGNLFLFLLKTVLIGNLWFLLVLKLVNIIRFRLLPNIRNCWAVGIALSAQTTKLSKPVSPQEVSGYNKETCLIVYHTM